MYQHQPHIQRVKLLTNTRSFQGRLASPWRTKTWIYLVWSNSQNIKIHKNNYLNKAKHSIVVKEGLQTYYETAFSKVLTNEMWIWRNLKRSYGKSDNPFLSKIHNTILYESSTLHKPVLMMIMTSQVISTVHTAKLSKLDIMQALEMGCYVKVVC